MKTKTKAKPAPIAQALDGWKQITNKEEFKRILSLLVEFDERTGRYLKYADPETHFARKTIANANPESVTIAARHLGGFVYSIVAQAKNSSTLCVTTWVHEDGIRQKRDTAEASHPVHSIVCITDIIGEAFPVMDCSESMLELMEVRGD